MKIILIVLFWLISVGVGATDYFVSDSDGSDSDSGLTTALAWKTLSKVNASTFTAGDQILFKKGDIWYGSLIAPSSGTLANRITFGAYGTGENPVISGFTTVSAWSNLGGNIWESTDAVSALSTCNVVVINGVLTPLGRYPKVSETNKGYLTYTASSTTSLTCAALDGSNWVGAEVVIRTSNFTIDRREITSHVGGVISWTTPTGRTPENGFGFFIQADARALTVQNDWYFNPSTKKIRIYSTSEPTSVKVTTVEKLIDITRNYITVDGIDFQGANQYAITHNTADTPAKTYIIVQNCKASFVHLSAALLRGTYISYLNNTVENSNGNALNTSSSSGYITITGNTVSKIGVNPGQATVHGALSSGNYSNNVEISENNLDEIGFNGITFHGQNIDLKNNVINEYCKILDDGGGIYTYTGNEDPLVNVVIDGNVITEGIGAPEGTNLAFPAIAAGIYCDNESEDIVIKNNTIYRARKYGIHLNENNHIDIEDNTVFDTWETQSAKTASQLKVSYPYNQPDNIANININRNIFVSKLANQYTIDFYSYYDARIQLFGTANNNVYARPIDDNKTIYADQPSEWSGSKEAKTLTEWQTFSGQDANSTKSPQAVTSEDDLRFEYNATTSTKTVSLSIPMIDMRGVQYASSVTLQPFTSVVLLKDANPAPPVGTPVIQRSGNGKWQRSINGKYQQ